jgi:hypothetical protein
MIVANIMRGLAGWWPRRTEQTRQDPLATQPPPNPGLIAAVAAHIAAPNPTHGGPSRTRPHWLLKWRRRNHRNARRKGRTA